MRRTEILKASPPMFQSRWLDRFTRVHHLVPVLLFLPAIVILFALGIPRAGIWTSLALAAGGYAFWTLTEYWLHRIVFHFEPEKGLGAKLHFLMHGVHHEHPNDPLRLVMPPSASVPLASLFVLAFWLIAGGPAWLAVSAGFLEETWSRNLVSLMASPVSEAEYMLGTGLFGLVKLVLGVGGVAVTALLCYSFDITSLGVGLLPAALTTIPTVAVQPLDHPAVTLRSYAVSRRGRAVWPPLALVLRLLADGPPERAAPSR